MVGHIIPYCIRGEGLSIPITCSSQSDSFVLAPYVSQNIIGDQSRERAPFHLCVPNRLLYTAVLSQVKSVEAVDMERNGKEDSSISRLGHER